MIVLDDDLQNLQDVIHKIRKHKRQGDEILGFTNPDAMVEYITTHACDVVFMKIEMQEKNGLDVAQIVKQIHPKANIIFESAFDCYMKNAFDIRCSGYLMLPIENGAIENELENLRFA